MADPLLYLEVAVAAPITKTLTYLPPANCGIELLPGMRLLVPLGGRQVTGYLLAFLDKPETKPARIKRATDILDQTPFFPAEMVPFYRWIADYYHYPIGEVIRGALPGGLTQQSGRLLVLTEKGKSTLSRIDPENHPVWLEKLLSTGTIPGGATRKIWRKPKEQRLLKEWQDQGLVEIQETITSDSVGIKTETCVTLTDSAEEKSRSKLKLSEQKTLDLILELAAQNAGPIPRRDLTRIYSGARQALKSLAAKGLVTLIEQAIYRDPFDEAPTRVPEPLQLTGEQEKALAEIIPAIEQNKFTPFLLHGVTGSGKTEIYAQATSTALQEGGSVLIMVPEIALATHLEGYFFSRFGDQVALLHSGLSKGERYDQWLRMMRGEAKVAIGARSAVFAPLKNIRLIIVDEEHDGAYKQEDGLRYQGRDLAVLRASLEEAPVILGSATPSVISFQHAMSGKYHLLNLKKRIEERPMPEVKVIDLKGIATVSGRPPLFSPELINALKENLANGEQSLIFLNRRGYASLMLCQDCGQPVQCRDCQVSLTLHQGRQELICHYCGYTIKSATVCSGCNSFRLIPIGFGTERLEAELVHLFPKARIARLDRDTTTNRRNFISILKAVHQQEVDILIGTQIITKGHHFPNVTLVGIVWADAGLGLPDYKSGERTFQLLCQATGRAGRGEKPGRVILQTHHPSHHSIITAQAHDYRALFDRELTLREKLNYPPFSRLVNLRIEGDQENTVKNFALTLSQIAKKKSGKFTTVLGPAPAPLARLRGQHRWQLLLKGNNISELRALTLYLMQNPPVKAGSGQVKLSVDVDPENML
ncbi:MAG: primosomal protein N' [Proteobacteria bacterium]|nr:primosomal protein N' [Pseudomonadota bacterium]MBU1715711.1 primosomal protein N' [Pseudomonadota bacterium]